MYIQHCSFLILVANKQLALQHKANSYFNSKFVEQMIYVCMYVRIGKDHHTPATAFTVSKTKLQFANPRIKDYLEFPAHTQEPKQQQEVFELGPLNRYNPAHPAGSTDGQAFLAFTSNVFSSLDLPRIFPSTGTGCSGTDLNNSPLTLVVDKLLIHGLWGGQNCVSK